ncbi:MAG: putative quinol monooxygenase [Steroidobacteraceae bacterium]
MSIGRRDFTQLSGAAMLAALAPGCASLATQPQTGESKMYGLIGKATCVPGKREEFIGVLLEGAGSMPGCLSYVAARDPKDPDAIWITEVWDSKESHTASLQLPAVRQAIVEGRPMIASFGDQIVTEPVGGHGLAQAR